MQSSPSVMISNLFARGCPRDQDFFEFWNAIRHRFLCGFKGFWWIRGAGDLKTCSSDKVHRPYVFSCWLHFSSPSFSSPQYFSLPKSFSLCRGQSTTNVFLGWCSDLINQWSKLIRFSGHLIWFVDLKYWGVFLKMGLSISMKSDFELSIWLIWFEMIWFWFTKSSTLAS